MSEDCTFREKYAFFGGAGMQGRLKSVTHYANIRDSTFEDLINVVVFQIFVIFTRVL
jgi:hypothetical protein